MNKVYIETTIPSYYVARPSANLIQAARQTITRKWWDEGCSGLETFTSQETLDEISRGEHDMAMQRMELIKDIGILEITTAVKEMAALLISKNIIHENGLSDAIHISVATLHAMDFLVTWNCRHIANPHAQNRLRRVASDLGFMLPVICTPEEFFNDENY
jgi:hypothetical protein